MANPEIQGQLWGDAPVVHGIGAELDPAHTETSFLTITVRRNGIAHEEAGQVGATIAGVEIGGELLVEGHVAAPVLCLEESVQPAPNVCSEFKGVVPANIREGILVLVVVLAQEFRKPVSRPQSAQGGESDVRESSGRRRPSRIKDAGYAQLLCQWLPCKVGESLHHIAGVADFDLVNFV